MQKLTIVSQVYPPDPAAVGQYLEDIAKEMVNRGWQVLVITANNGYDDPSVRYPRTEMRDGVQIQRLPLSSGGKKSILSRLTWQLFFCLQAIFFIIIHRRRELLLVSTSPPVVNSVAVALSLLCGTKFIWWVMDINPDQAVQSKNIGKKNCFVRLLDIVNKHTLQLASQIVTLDKHMERRLLMKLPSSMNKIVVIPPWPHNIIEKGSQDFGEKFRKLYKLDGFFIVMYSGNHSAMHPLDTLLGAAEQLRENSKIKFLFIGGGVDKVKVENRIKEMKLSNVLSLPYQPLEALNESLSAGDLHIVTMGENMVGLVHPCKIYGSMALRKPIIYIGPTNSHVGELIESSGCGWQFNHGNVHGVASKILEAVSIYSIVNKSDGVNPKSKLFEIGSKGANLIESRFGSHMLTEKLGNIISHIGRETGIEGGED